MYEVIDAYLIDPCNDVVLRVITTIPSFVQRCTSIHMIAEQLVRSLQRLFIHKNHVVRFNAIHSIYLLFRVEIDRNEIMFENYYSSLLSLVTDSYDDVQQVVLGLFYETRRRYESFSFVYRRDIIGKFILSFWKRYRI